MDIYLSSKILEKSVINRDCLWHLIHHASFVNIFVDIRQEELDKITMSDDNIENCLWHRDILYNDIPIRDGVDILKKVRFRDDIPGFFPSNAIIILTNIPDKIVDEIQQKYGIICLSGENYCEKIPRIAEIRRSNYFDTNNYYEHTNKITSWSNFLCVPKESVLPCNTLIFTDLYLLKDDKDASNVKEILSSLCNNVNKKTQVQILFIIKNQWGDFEKDNLPEELGVLIKNFSEKATVGLKPKDNVRIEFILCDNKYQGKYELYSHSHNRKFITNFIFASAEHSFSAFNIEGTIKYNQRVSLDIIFNMECLYEYNTLVKTIAEDVLYAIKEPPKNQLYSPYRAIGHDFCNKNGCVCINLKDLKNRIIMERIQLKDGTKCWYLSVPYENDWLNIKYLGGIYKSKDYLECIADIEPKPVLEKMIEQIKQLFSNHNYEKGDESGLFYWISVSTQSAIRTVHIKNSQTDTKPENCYPKNCFKNEEDAKKILKEMKRIFNLD